MSLCAFQYEMPSTTTAPAAQNAASFTGDTRRPVTSIPSIANAGTIASTPPKSLPHAGSPSTATATTPMTATSAAATALRSRRSGNSDSHAAVRIAATANSANAWLPNP
ncbi:hypothetical protein DMH08_06105 [Actinomadura sp. WAC 06369]|nr:hypothetical protein DMH08_06105 [Actinomadura sp. WAC 06369]